MKRRLAILAVMVLAALAVTRAVLAEPRPPAGSQRLDHPAGPWAPMREDTAPAPVPPAPAPPGAARLVEAPPSLVWAALRVLGALVVVVVAMAGSLAAYRRLVERRGAGEAAGGRLGWFSRWVPASVSDADRLQIVSRSYLGAKESICVVQAGRERFLVGIGPTGISLLGRLETPRDPAGAAMERLAGHDEPAVTDFAQELTLAEAEAPETEAERSIRAAVTRSRERLARLQRLHVVRGGALHG